MKLKYLRTIFFPFLFLKQLLFLLIIKVIQTLDNSDITLGEKLDCYLLTYSKINLS